MRVYLHHFTPNLPDGEFDRSKNRGVGIIMVREFEYSRLDTPEE